MELQSETLFVRNLTSVCGINVEAIWKRFLPRSHVAKAKEDDYFYGETTSERVDITRSEWLSTAIRRQASATLLIYANFEAETFCIA